MTSKPSCSKLIWGWRRPRRFWIALKVTARADGLTRANELSSACGGTPLQAVSPPEFSLADKPTVILVVGVNGSGKTTTLAKLAARFNSEGRKVLLGAADTFRAAAVDQLQVWGDRLKVEVIAGRFRIRPGRSRLTLSRQELPAASTSS